MSTSEQGRKSVQGASTASCLLTPEGTVLACSSTLLDFLGKNTAAVTDRSCRDAFSCSAAMEEQCPLARTVKSHRKSSARLSRNGLQFEETTDPLFDASGTVSAVMLSITGSAGSVSTLPDLIRLEKLAAMAQAASGVVHDFNNILTLIGGTASLLKDRLPDKGGDPDHETLMAAIEQGKALTGHLLEFGRGHGPDKTVLFLKDVIRHAVSFSMIGQPIRPVVGIEDGLWPVKANAGQMMQLISNLTLNAIHAAGKKERVWVCAENVPARAAAAAGLESRKHIMITVRDEGHGIPPDHMEHIFEPFFTTKKHGTGLGLATSQLIVKDHTGRITVKSQVGHGTTFTVYLPAATGPAASGS